MTDQRINGGLSNLGGKLQEGLGKLTGDTRLQLDGKLDQVKGKYLDGYGKVIDGLDGFVAKAPTDLQEPARVGLDFARKKPFLTTAIVAGLGLLLAGAGRRRR
ncbi:CsbD family protein [Brevundimonas goettingensis]|jgi:uncharacterized protein YjbJ (UPF0337 family)|uniref:CsbD family protein n=1 Tax=Brevundimonas goettingensis TaxID=2774190 RepID=A0A975C3E0_9CAUL|nr:CsbD family protein [Brevundimonas goettingensis]QTC93106.1 CsbD family protein [Brevundimonas goettingensis]